MGLGDNTHGTCFSRLADGFACGAVRVMDYEFAARDTVGYASNWVCMRFVSLTGFPIRFDDAEILIFENYFVGVRVGLECRLPCLR